VAAAGAALAALWAFATRLPNTLADLSPAAKFAIVDPVDRQAHFAEATGSFAQAELHKVYHLNVFLTLGRLGPDGQREEQIDHLRIVLDKNGVVRIEPVHLNQGASSLAAAERGPW